MSEKPKKETSAGKRSIRQSLDEATAQSETPSPTDADYNLVRPRYLHGRPHKLTPEIIARIIELANAGKSIRQISREMQIGRSQFFRWSEIEPSFRSILEDCKDFGIAWWEDIGQTHSVVNADSDKVDSTIWLNTLKSRCDDYKNKESSQGPSTVVYATDGALTIQSKS